MVRCINFLLYQVGWFACVLGAAHARPWLGSSIALALVVVHLMLATDRRGQIQILTLAAMAGLAVDTLLVNLGVFRFPSGVLVSWLPPIWMPILWLQFATTFGYSFDWLSGRYRLTAAFALAGAPLAFLAGEKLGAVTFQAPRLMHFIILGVVWSFTLPLLIAAADRQRMMRNLPTGYYGFSSQQASPPAAGPLSELCSRYA